MLSPHLNSNIITTLHIHTYMHTNTVQKSHLFVAIFWGESESELYFLVFILLEFHLSRIINCYAQIKKGGGEFNKK